MAWKKFLDQVKEPLNPEDLKKYLKRAAIAGTVMWTVVYVLLVVNVVGLGLWPVVAIPLGIWAWGTHLARSWEQYLKLTKPKAVAQNINVVVNADTGLTPEAIADAARKAVQDLQFGR